MVKPVNDVYFRFNSIIFEHEDNILVPEVIQQLYQIHKNVLNIQTSNGKHWPDLCIQLPVVDLDSDQMPSKPESRRKRAVADKPQPVNDDFFADFGGDAFGSMEEPVYVTQCILYITSYRMRTPVQKPDLDNPVEDYYDSLSIFLSHTVNV